MRDLCESAKRGRGCSDDLYRGGDVTLCGFDKDEYQRLLDEYEDDEFAQYDENDPLGDAA